MKYLLEGEESERLYFRKLEPSDFDYFLEFFRFPTAADYLGLEEKNDPVIQCHAWFNRIFFRYENDLGGMNVLVDKFSGQVIGQCGILIQNIDGVSEFEIGYSIMPRFWGMQYATEAAQKSKLCAFSRGYSDSLISIIHIDNIKSAKVAKKNGMFLEKQTVFKGMPVDIFRIFKNKTEF